MFDAKGNIYGMTRSSGIFGPVTLFRLTRPVSNPGGPWAHAELFRIDGKGLVSQPAGGLTRGPDGTLYGAIGANAKGSLGYIFSFKP